MKKLLCLALLSCNNIFALPAWQFTISSEYNGEIVHQASDPILFRPDRKSGSLYVPHTDGKGYGITVTCTELGNDEVEYVAEDGYTRTTVIAKIGQDASVTIQTSPQGAVTITFSSRI